MIANAESKLIGKHACLCCQTTCMVVDAVQGNEKQCSLANRPDVHTWYIAFRVKPWIYTYLFTRIFYVFVCNHIDNLFNVETYLADKLTANNKKKNCFHDSTMGQRQTKVRAR